MGKRGAGMGLGEQKCRVGRQCRREGDDLEDMLLGSRLFVDMRPPWLAPSTRQSWKLWRITTEVQATYEPSLLPAN